jgi:hypothetical protein
VQKAWKLTRKDIMRIPAVTDVDDAIDDKRGAHE